MTQQKRQKTEAFKALEKGMGEMVDGISAAIQTEIVYQDRDVIVEVPVPVYEDRLIALETFHPTPFQPRRVVPSRFRQFPINDSLIAWYEDVSGECGEIVTSLMRNEDVGERPKDFSAFALSLLDLVTLAASIYFDGLANPITAIAQSDGSFVIDTGERRWVAYHWLRWWFENHDKLIPDDPRDFGFIPMREVSTANIWRQAAENTARQNLNAVAKARQFSLLLMSLLDKEFQSLGAFSHERRYYAQSAYIDSVPYGKRDQVLAAMGFKSAAELTRCRNLLTLPDLVWDIADDRSVPQQVLLSCLKKPESEAIKIVSSWNDLPQRSQTQEKKQRSNLIDKTTTYTTQLEESLKRTKAKTGERRQVAQLLRDAAERIERGV